MSASKPLIAAVLESCTSRCDLASTSSAGLKSGHACSCSQVSCFCGAPQINSRENASFLMRMRRRLSSIVYQHVTVDNVCYATFGGTPRIPKAIWGPFSQDGEDAGSRLLGVRGVLGGRENASVTSKVLVWSGKGHASKLVFDDLHIFDLRTKRWQTVFNLSAEQGRQHHYPVPRYCAQS